MFLEKSTLEALRWPRGQRPPCALLSERSSSREKVACRGDCPRKQDLRCNDLEQNRAAWAGSRTRALFCPTCQRAFSTPRTHEGAEGGLEPAVRQETALCCFPVRVLSSPSASCVPSRFQHVRGWGSCVLPIPPSSDETSVCWSCFFPPFYVGVWGG